MNRRDRYMVTTYHSTSEVDHHFPRPGLTVRYARNRRVYLEAILDNGLPVSVHIPQWMADAVVAHGIEVEKDGTTA